MPDNPVVVLIVRRSAAKLAVNSLEAIAGVVPGNGRDFTRNTPPERGGIGIPLVLAGEIIHFKSSADVENRRGKSSLLCLQHHMERIFDSRDLLTLAGSINMKSEPLQFKVRIGACGKDLLSVF